MPGRHRWIGWTDLGALILVWAAAFGITVFGAVSQASDRSDLHVSGYLDCGSSPSPTRITAAPTARIALSGHTATVELTLSLQSTAAHCQVSYTPIGPEQTAQLDGRAMDVPERGPWAVVVPTDGREHDVRLRWTGRRSATTEAVGRSVFTISTYLAFPPGRGQVLGTERLDDSDGAVLQVSVPAGHRPRPVTGGIRRGREVAVPVGVGGLESGLYRIEYDHRATRWIGAAAPFVLAVSTTLLVVLAGHELIRRRRRADPGVNDATSG